jgi:hypothetical protein
VGVVVGTTALNGPVLDGLRDRNAGLISDKRALESDVRGLQADVETADDLVRAMSGDLIGSRLEGRRVLLVKAPGADERTTEQIATTLAAADGQVTGRLSLHPALFESGSTQLLEDLAAAVIPAGVRLPEESAVARVGAVLSAALVVSSDGSAVDRDAAQQIVSAFQEAGLVELDDAGETPAAASLVVLVAAAAPTEPVEDDGRTELDGLLAVAAQLDTRSDGLVVAGPADAAVEGGLIRALRSDSARDEIISSVDNADRAVGQVAVVLALREQAQGGSGRYGGAQGASAPAPTATASPAPEPEPAPQPEPAPPAPGG